MTSSKTSRTGLKRRDVATETWKTFPVTSQKLLHLQSRLIFIHLSRENPPTFSTCEEFPIYFLFIPPAKMIASTLNFLNFRGLSNIICIHLYGERKTTVQSSTFSTFLTPLFSQQNQLNQLEKVEKVEGWHCLA
jgi:hypothetical protein